MPCLFVPKKKGKSQRFSLKSHQNYIVSRTWSRPFPCRGGDIKSQFKCQSNASNLRSSAEDCKGLQRSAARIQQEATKKQLYVTLMRAKAIMFPLLTVGIDPLTFGPSIFLSPPVLRDVCTVPFSKSFQQEGATDVCLLVACIFQITVEVDGW